MSSKQISVCLFCGSRPGDNPAFLREAESFGTGLAKRGHRLVYGAGDRGLMGAAAQACQDAKGAVTGVIPQHLVDAEIGKQDLDEYVVVDTMHERKMLMFERSDAIVALPGGPGTLDELMEVLTWRQLGLHARPVMLINVDGYWDPLLDLIDHIIGHGFADPGFQDLMMPVPTAEDAITTIEAALS